MRRTIVLLLALMGAVGVFSSALTGCGSDPVTTTTALDFDAPLVSGGRLDFRTLSGSAVALWFWAPG